MPLPPTFDARLARRRALTKGVCELTFERSDGAAFVFEAGQWVSLVLPCADGEIRRAYSVASPPRGTPELQIAVTHVEGGPGSTFLHCMDVGTTIRVVGPQGFFTRPLATAGPALFVGTGTGVTPLRSMIHAAAAAAHPAPMWLLFGHRTEADLLYRDELDALAASHANVRVFYTLSRPDAGWTGRTGYVQTHVTKLWTELASLGAGVPHAYICGLQKMVGAVRDVLRNELQVERKQVHSERYD